MEENLNNISKLILYVIPTPIGNLEDITIRAVRILKLVDIIACEDTRHTGNLLKHLEIKNKKLVSYYEQNEKQKAEFLISEILNGKSVGLVTDAGMPSLSDPGYRLIKEAINNNIQVVPLPGPTALIPALVASGFAIHDFRFLGFPPQKKGRQTFLKKLIECEYTCILYESPHRIQKLILELNNLGIGDRNICLAREITKIHEEFIRVSIHEAVEILNMPEHNKGEFVVVLEGCEHASKEK